MAWRSIWACGSVIGSTVRPNVAEKLSKWGFSSKQVKESLKKARALCSPLASKNDHASQSSVTLAVAKPNCGRGNVKVLHKVQTSQISGSCLSRSFSSGYDDERNDQRLPLRLMDFSEIIWPSLLKSLKNRFFAMLITGYYDRTFSIDSFLEGCTQAVSLVSSCISEGNFESLQGLVDEEAIQEIRNSYADLSVSQRRFIHVNPRDIFFRFVYEIGMMFDDETDQRFVEVTVVLQGFHGYHEAKEKEPVAYYNEVRESQDRMYVCNYRFIREFTKGVEGDWSINKLNHFYPNKGFTMR